MKKIHFLLALLFGFQFLFSQTATESHLKDHVYFLADDKLEGRATGSAAEKLASDYIANQFASIGLKAAEGTVNFLESFEVNAGKVEGPNNFISFSNIIYKSPEVFPITFSSNQILEAEFQFAGYGISATELNYDDYANIDVKGKIAIIKLSTPESNNPHSKFADYDDARTKVLMAVLKGAKGVIFFNDDPDVEIPTRIYTHNSPRESIPVLFAEKKIIDSLKLYTGKIRMSADLTDIIKTGHNVVGYLNNNAVNTIIIGAHYDHLGHGEIEGSLYRGEPAIHNGADDNASGVSLIIELARKLSASNLKNNNYLFIAFSGEEMGLFGSKAFVNSDLFKKYSINYMLNFDMVGRLDTSNILIINGTGTSPAWTILDQIKIDSIKIKKSEGGIGPSDQTSFYLKDIPVLHFFTGSHQDYHKPSDDADKVNFVGMESVLDYVYVLIEDLNQKEKIAFTKTQDASKEDIPSFKVTLGVVPDYAYSGKGMRIDGVSDGKPASKAGLLAGDIVIKLGDYDVSEMMSYMKALSKFTKGDTTNVTFLRDGKELILPVTF